MNANKNTPIIKFNNVIELEDYFSAIKKAGLQVDERNVYRGEGGVYAICEVEPMTDARVKSWFMIDSCEGYNKDSQDIMPLVIFIN